MGPPFGLVWGPYGSPMEARSCLCRFVDKVCGLDVGVAWTSGGAVYPIRRPGRDSAGFGHVIMFEWYPAPPPRQVVKPLSLFGRLERAVGSALAQIGQQQIARSENALAISQTLAQAFGTIRMGQRSDAAGVALDVVCVALSIGILGAGMSLIGGAALLGGAVLLLADGIAYSMEMSGDDEAAEKFKNRAFSYNRNGHDASRRSVGRHKSDPGVPGGSRTSGGFPSDGADRWNPGRQDGQCSAGIAICRNRRARPAQGANPCGEAPLPVPPRADAARHGSGIFLPAAARGAG